MKTIKKMLDRWNQYNQTVRELSSLDKRALDDLGITRADIRDVARQNLPIY